MRMCGVNKVTEFTKKQVNVIYAKSKNGELNVPKEVIKDFYNLAEYYGYDDNRVVERCESVILNILENVFAGDNEKAQQLIDEYAEKHM